MFAACASILCLAFGGTLPATIGTDGRIHHPLQEAAGKPVLFLFISHDCPVCNTYAPEIGRLEAKYQGRVAFNIAYCDATLSASQAAAHAKEFGIAKATLLLDIRCDLAAFCKATITPQAVLFDERARRVYSGRIDDRYFALGRQRPSPTSHDLAMALDSVLAHRPPKPAAGAPVGCFIVFPNSK